MPGRTNNFSNNWTILTDEEVEENSNNTKITPVSILKPIRFGKKKDEYAQKMKRRNRASSYTCISFASTPIIHEFVVLTKQEIKQAKYEAEKLKRKQDKAERRKQNNSSPVSGGSNGSDGGRSSPSNNSPSKKKRHRYNKKMDEMHPSKMKNNKNNDTNNGKNSKKNNSNSQGGARANKNSKTQHDKAEYVSRLNKDLIKKNLLRLEQKRNLKFNTKRKHKNSLGKKLMKNLWYVVIL
jgi:hypothetical protein